MDDERVLAWAALLRAHAAVVPRLEAELQRAGQIPLRWYDVLLTLVRAPRTGVRMQELADAAVLSRTRVSRVVDELEAAGLVRREPNPADGRSTMVAITNAGRAAFRRAAPVYLRGIGEHFTDLLSPEELHAIRDALEKVVAAHRARGSRSSP